MILILEPWKMASSKIIIKNPVVVQSRESPSQSEELLKISCPETREGRKRPTTARAPVVSTWSCFPVRRVFRFRRPAARRPARSSVVNKNILFSLLLAGPTIALAPKRCSFCVTFLPTFLNDLAFLPPEPSFFLFFRLLLLPVPLLSGASGAGEMLVALYFARGLLTVRPASAAHLQKSR